MKQTLITIFLTATLPSALFADDVYWTDREICRAAAKTYFFLDTMPADAPDQGDLIGFRSDAGNIYACKIEGASTAFYWVNKSGEAMESKSSSYSVDGDRLHIKTDMMVEDFSAK